MHDLDLLVPSALVEPGIAPDLLRDQTLPTLERIVARGGPVESFESPITGSLTAWQAWLFGSRDTVPFDRINLAELWARACGVTAAPHGGRFLVEPAHFTIANDHLRLDDPSTLAVTLPEARALAATIEPVLERAGWRLDPIAPATLTHWLVTRDDGAQLSGAAIEKAIGDNVAAWQPRVLDRSRRSEAAGGDGSGKRAGQSRDDRDDRGADSALAWRSCVNEIQMLWFGHPVNEAREANGQPTVNTLWLSGNGMPAVPAPRYAAVESGLRLLASLPIDPDAPRVLESFDRFVEPARSDDWSGWREQLERLDACLAGVARRQAEGSIGSLTLVLCGRDRAKVVTIGRRDLRSMWRGWFRKAPPLADLFADLFADLPGDLPVDGVVA